MALSSSITSARSGRWHNYASRWHLDADRWEGAQSGGTDARFVCYLCHHSRLWATITARPADGCGEPYIRSGDLARARYPQDMTSSVLRGLSEFFCFPLGLYSPTVFEETISRSSYIFWQKPVTPLSTSKVTIVSLICSSSTLGEWFDELRSKLSSPD